VTARSIDPLEKIRKWLRSEPAESSWHPADQGWKTIIDVDERTGLRVLKARSNKLPFELSAFILPSGKCIRLTVSSGVETEGIDKSLRVLIYRELLILNSIVELVKYVIISPKDTLAVAVDLEVSALDENIFRDSLLALFAGLIVMIERLGLTELLTPTARGALAKIHESLLREYSIPSPLDFISRVHVPKVTS